MSLRRSCLSVLADVFRCVRVVPGAFTVRLDGVVAEGVNTGCFGGGVCGFFLLGTSSYSVSLTVLSGPAMQVVGGRITDTTDNVVARFIEGSGGSELTVPGG